MLRLTFRRARESITREFATPIQARRGRIRGAFGKTTVGTLCPATQPGGRSVATSLRSSVGLVTSQNPIRYCLYLFRTLSGTLSKGIHHCGWIDLLGSEKESSCQSADRPRPPR